MKIILASGSPFRRALLANAGLDFSIQSPAIDERAVEAAIAGETTPEDVAAILAEAKALDVSAGYSDALVIGCDQTLSFDGQVLHKAADMEGARRRLLELSGRSHSLNSAVALARNGEIVWRHTGIARLTMRRLDPAFVGRHLAKVGMVALQSVGCYQVEGEGIQLFERIEGDYFTIVGLPLLPLLAALREFKVIDG